MNFFKRKWVWGGLAIIGVVLVIFVDFDSFGSPGTEASPSISKGSISEALNSPDTTDIKNAVVANGSNQKILSLHYPIIQTFNNCPAGGLAITLSYYGIIRTQSEIADELRPNWNLNGKNDDKSTPPERVAEGAKKYGFIPYYRANGSIELLKKFIANDTPILMRTKLNSYEPYHHYIVVSGYDDVTGEIIQDDSYYGSDIRYKYSDFLKLWKHYNYEYVVLATPENRGTIEKILGGELDQMKSWQNAVAGAQSELVKNPNDNVARFNLAVSLYYTGDYARAVSEFEKVESSLSKYALWFRIEPIKAYFELKNDTRVFSLADKIFADGNLGYSELYLVRGKTYLRDGKTDLAKKDFEKAVFYNENFKEAKEALAGAN